MFYLTNAIIVISMMISTLINAMIEPCEYIWHRPSSSCRNRKMDRIDNPTSYLKTLPNKNLKEIGLSFIDLPEKVQSRVLQLSQNKITEPIIRMSLIPYDTQLAIGKAFLWNDERDAIIFCQLPIKESLMRRFRAQSRNRDQDIPAHICYRFANDYDYQYMIILKGKVNAGCPLGSYDQRFIAQLNNTDPIIIQKLFNKTMALLDISTSEKCKYIVKESAKTIGNTLYRLCPNAISNLAIFIPFCTAVLYDRTTGFRRALKNATLIMGTTCIGTSLAATLLCSPIIFGMHYLQLSEEVKVSGARIKVVDIK